MALRSAAISLLALLFFAPAIVDAERLPARVSRRLMDWPITQIHRIVHDSRGYLWFCTREGLSRFDGHGFTTYGIDEGLAQRRYQRP